MHDLRMRTMHALVHIRFRDVPIWDTHEGAGLRKPHRLAFAWIHRTMLGHSKTRTLRMIVAVLGIFAAIAPQPAHAIGTPCQEFSIFVDLVEATFPGGQPYQRTQDNTFGTSGKTVMEHPFLDNTCGTSSTTASSLAYTPTLGIGTQKTSMVEIGVVVWYGNFPDTSTLNYGIFTEAENYPNVAGPYIDYNLASTYPGPVWLKIEGFRSEERRGGKEGRSPCAP